MPFLASFGGGSARGFNPGGGGFDWGQFSTGDVYQGGYIRVIDSTTLEWWFYPTQRTNGQTNAGGSLESTVTLEGGASVRFFVFGGGGGGSGTNGSGGGGGGFASSVTATTLNPGQVISYQGGGAGLGGVAQDPGLSNLNYLGSSSSNPPNQSTSGLESYVFLGASSGSTSFYLRALGGTTAYVVNPTQYADCGQGGAGIVQTNTLGLSTSVGSGGDGGSRNLRGESGTGGGGGGGNNYTGSGLDTGGASTKAGGGGGGSGNAQTPSSGQNGGGSGGTYGFTGGMGGDTDSNTFGFQGDDLKTDVSSAFPVGAGYAYQNSDNTAWGIGTVLGKGSAGGGGFPSGGGGSSYYGGNTGNFGVGGDGASGAVMLRIGF